VIRRTVQEYFDRKPHTELNPDEVVALGAAVQANILDRGVSNMLLLDVTPLSLGIETYGGAVAKVIPRNSTIPASAQEMYTPASTTRPASTFMSCKASANSPKIADPSRASH